ncbi:hypothetical protein [Uliginosibacterium sp. H1]|uniref:hypothetical protein n=1 Tax=Uliginosibacterium sp. H1 TaxID=3114757 RepID=UPI002E173BC5|nr:hypothetical protein [Uliginosibacterium sp. H1]
MIRKLVVDHRLLSLRGRMTVREQSDRLVYEAAASGLLFPTWHVAWFGQPVATIRRRYLSLSPAWALRYAETTALVRLRRLAPGSHFEVCGGPHDGAGLRRQFGSDAFHLVHRDETLALARHARTGLWPPGLEVEIFDASPTDELFAVLMMIVARLDMVRGPMKQ